MESADEFILVPRSVIAEAKQIALEGIAECRAKIRELEEAANHGS